MVSGVWPSAWASKFKMMRWRSTAGAISRISSMLRLQTAAHERQHASAFDQRLGAARRTAIANVFVGERVSAGRAGLRGHDQVNGEILHVRGDQNFAAGGAQLQNRFAVHHLFERGLVAMNGALDDAVQILARRIGHQDLHQEAVELGFGQRIGAFHLDGILRGHHEERQFELMRGGAAGDGALLHGFEQRGLRLGRGAVDFIGQHQVGEDGARLEAQRLVRRDRRSR